MLNDIAPEMLGTSIRGHNEIAPKPELDAMGDLRFRRLLPEGKWQSLPKSVRQRFTKRIKAGESVVYCGQVKESRANWAGWFLAKGLKLIGAPLPLSYDNEGAAAIVSITEDASSAGQIWSRQYNRANGFPQVVHSAKSFTGATGIEETIGWGIGMSLVLDVREGQLLFKSHHYFFTLFGRQFKLPKAISPGSMVIGHRDLGDGWFEFTLRLVHPVLGTLMYQRANFHDMMEK